ncbi:MAG: hypothetical protein WDM91_08640 [Rhizomicrobium sp.]
MWWQFSYDVVAAGIEAQQVIALRLVKLAKGDAAAQREAQTMVREKLLAGMEAAATLASGGSPTSVLRRYRTIMRANQKRLASGRRKRR